MHAATDNIATAVIVVVVVVVVVIVGVGIVSVIVSVGSEAEPYKRTSVKSASVKSSTACETSMKAATAEASSA
jgi:cytoskeletal protein RodZ